MQHPTLSDLFRVFVRIGLLSFGGPAAQISLMHTELVDRHKWLNEQQFLGALSFCMLLPGPEAMQLATYAGWRLHGVRGGLLAGLLFVLPGALVILGLALGYAYFGDLPLVQALFVGVQAAVIAIVFQALLNLSRKALKGWDSWALALLGFIAIFALSVPFPAIIAAAALWGSFAAPRNTDTSATARATRTPITGTLRTIGIWGALWLAPLLILWAMDADFLAQIGLFFSKLAVVTFGGAYAVLAYMTQAAVETHGWLTTEQMIDALGLAETTPGPLILVTEFVGLLAGFQQGGVMLALAAGLLTLWVTFMPCFLWIFAGAPYVENILARPRLKGALAAISAAVVGVILNLSVWFALHVLFAEVGQGAFGPLPDLSSFRALNASFVALACGLFLLLRLPMLTVLALMAMAAGIAHFFA
ncbi:MULTISPECIES: chromate efflux transporter [unclassified Roseovarius]|uniref:chromate efflux transporter n=1 Tax=unclassified Roseovarius TaxID=2614913 RepID=UPI00273FA1D8|nr:MULTISPECIES: chromate efflux transporter [unclassified Roseovarius]